MSDEEKPEGQADAPALDEHTETHHEENEHKHQKSSKIHGLKQRLQHFREIYWGKKFIAIPATVVVVLGLLFAIPFTRYSILGLALKKQVNVVITDDKTNKPVSGADVSIAGKTAKTDGSGKATINKVPVGNHKLLATKKYYKDFSKKTLVKLSSMPAVNLQMTATGRQVPIVINNKITGKAVGGAVIKIGDADAKTDDKGQATLVLPVGTDTQDATVTLAGYNDAHVKVKVTDQVVPDNTFTVTPAGKVYFLSKLSGKIDVVKTDLDGANRQTVLAGTGHEDETGTVLLASRDWKYLALRSVRDTTGNAQINLIDTSNDKLANIDKGDASFDLVGWSGHYFVYTVSRNGYETWQPNQQALKSYNADTNKLTVLNQTAGKGNGQYNYAREYFGSIYLIDNSVIYDKLTQNTYYYVPGAGQVGYTLASGIYKVDVDGSNSQTLQAFPDEVGLYTTITAVHYKPNGIDYRVIKQSGVSTAYFSYMDGKFSSRTDIATELNDYLQSSKTYLGSPSGGETFWSESRDGKNTLFIGDKDGNNGKQIATLSEYDTYGWYTDSYLLVSKDGSELYIMSHDGGTPLKVSDYHKPVYGYGGGYGGY